MARFSFLIVILFFFTETYCQHAFGIVYLKNGSIIKGNIIGNTENGINIETYCGNIFHYQPDEIIRIEKDDEKHRFIYRSQYKTSTKPDTTEQKMLFEKGSMISFSSGILLGNYWNARQAPYSSLIEYNYRFIPYFAAGAVGGYEFLNESTIPLGINLKIMYPTKRVNIYTGFSAGYNFSVENPDEWEYQNHSGGVLINVEGGIHVKLSSNNAFFIAAGYRYNELHYKVYDWWQDTIKRVIYFNRFSLRMGIVLF